MKEMYKTIRTRQEEKIREKTRESIDNASSLQELETIENENPYKKMDAKTQGQYNIKRHKLKGDYYLDVAEKWAKKNNDTKTQGDIGQYYWENKSDGAEIPEEYCGREIKRNTKSLENDNASWIKSYNETMLRKEKKALDKAVEHYSTAGVSSNEKCHHLMGDYYCRMAETYTGANERKGEEALMQAREHYSMAGKNEKVEFVDKLISFKDHQEASPEIEKDLIRPIIGIPTSKTPKVFPRISITSSDIEKLVSKRPELASVFGLDAA